MAGARRGAAGERPADSTEDEELHVPVRAHHLCEVCTFEDAFGIVLLAMKAYDTT